MKRLPFLLILSLSFSACSDDEDAANGDAATNQDATTTDSSLQQPDGSASDSAVEADSASQTDGQVADALVGDARIADAEVVDGEIADAEVINKCPARDPAGTACKVPDAQCDTGSGCCICEMGTTCNRWFCAEPSENSESCPALAPRLGGKCTAMRSGCSYCTAKGPRVYTCVDGSWELDEFVVTCRAG